MTVKLPDWPSRRDVRGVTALEYALVAALVACAIVGGVAAIGNAEINLWYTALAKFLAVMPHS